MESAALFVVAVRSNAVRILLSCNLESGTQKLGLDRYDEDTSLQLRLE